MLKYIGQGAALIGIPARNLSDDEVAKFGKKRLLKTGLYVQVRGKLPEHTQEPDKQEQAEE